MKELLTIIIMTSAVSLNAQKGLTGLYKDYFGNTIKINTDSTFEHKWNFDMQSSWVIGIWSRKDDTVFFSMVPVYDTVQVSKQERNA